MDFTSLSFLSFLAAVAILYRFFPGRFRAALLLFASYAFYMSTSISLALLMFGATLAAYLLGRLIPTFSSPFVRRASVTVFISSLVTLLALYKAAPILRDEYGWSLTLPLGISYYFFKLISYVVDVHWGKVQPENDFVPFAAYAAFFPQIVAGPIQRSESLLPQLHDSKAPSLAVIVSGVQRILLGFFKKFVVADNLGLLVNFEYGHLHTAGVPLLPAFYAFPIQMYADFSGLTDIANGAACLLGIQPVENFNFPFLASSPSEYWRRWHISLTRWLGDYVFTPLRLSTRALGEFGLVISLFANMILIALWHGFRWTFVMFGVIHAIYLCADALTARSRKRFYKKVPAVNSVMNWLGPLVTFHFVAIAFVFFRADKLGDCAFLLGHIGQGLAARSTVFSEYWLAYGHAVSLGFAAYFLAEALEYARRTKMSPVLHEHPRRLRWAMCSCTAFAVILFLCLFLVNGSVHSPFIYAVF